MCGMFGRGLNMTGSLWANMRLVRQFTESRSATGRTRRNNRMPQPNQDTAARRIQPSYYDAGYDCELPPSVRTELTQPKRPRILSRLLPVKTTQRWPFYVMLSLCLVALGGAVTTLWCQQERSRASSTGTTSQPLAPQPTPATTSAPTPGPARSPWRTQLAQHPEQFSRE